MSQYKDWRLTFRLADGGKIIKVKNQTAEGLLGLLTAKYGDEFRQAKSLLIEALDDE